MLSDANELVAHVARLMAIRRASIAVVRVAVCRVTVFRIAIVRIVAIGSELRAIASWRQTIRGLKVANKVTLICESDAETNLLYAEEARLEEIFGPLHAQQT